MKPTQSSLFGKAEPGLFRSLPFPSFSIYKKLKTAAVICAAVLIGHPLISQEACGTTIDPAVALEHEDRIADELAAFTKAFIKNEAFRKSVIKVVPVQFHIVRMDNGAGGVSYPAIQAELEVVNNRYAPDLQFAECGAVDYINSSQYYTLTSSSEGTQMSFQYNEPDVMNIYIVGDPDGFCGWAYYSSSVPTDYIVIANACASNTSTMAHEIGHYFDLYHTHHTSFGAECANGSNCATAGDRLCDTPADPTLSSLVDASCEYIGTELDGCNSQPYTPDVTNIMSYSRKACRDYFSPSQRAKVVFTANNGRSYLRYDCAPLSIINSAMYCDLGLDIPDAGCGAEELTANVRVEGELAVYLGEDVFLESVDLIIDHNNNNDLEISLTSPNGVEVLLSSHNGGTGNNYGNPNNCFNSVASFSMNAANSISSLSNQNTNILGPYIPEGDLNDFHDATDPNGNWTVRVCDNAATFKGRLEYVKLNFNVLPPVNDDVCAAKPVDVGAAFHVIGVFASSEFGEIHPGVGFPESCEEQNGWCDIAPEPSIENSTWFTFVAPPSGQVDISMDNDDDAQFALWSVGDCGDFNSFLEIAANDDSGLFGFSPFIDGACVVPGQVYYLQVDGFDGTPYDTYITVTDVGVPLHLTCPPDLTINCEESIEPAQLGEAGANTNDCCGTSPIMSYADATMTVICPNNYTLARTWTANYDCGYTAVCEQLIMVEDLSAPAITCPADISVGCATDVSPTNAGMATAVDNCGPAAITSADEIVDGSCQNNFSIIRKWMATDECNGQAVCEQTISVEDTSSPDITCPPNVTVGCETDPSAVNTGMATATDNCSAATITSDDVISNENCPNEYTITRSWTATDGCNAAVFCEQIIMVNDGTAPSITCPADVTIACEEDLSSIDTGVATATDNCSAATVISNDIMIIGNCPNEYAIQRIWTATDECSGQSICEQMVFVVDTTVPAITCPADVTVECGEDASPANTGMATGTDNCGAVTIAQNDVLVAGNCTSNMIFTRTWTATDECGRQSTCGQTIHQEDTQAPAMNCPDAITITPSANGNYDFPQAEIDLLGAGSMDNCGVVSFSISQTHFTCADEGLQSVLLTGADECGNTADCQVNITVNPFLQIENSTVTDESCAGAGDGEILLIASALGGEVNYSINGGTDFQADGHFANLSAGDYDMVIKVVGITEVCEITGEKSVGSGASGETWYQDADGDGFHNGISTQSCDPIPGYSTTVLPGDCDDNNPLTYPGATELCDGLDNDCDGQVPATELDTDADGHRPCDGDCDDNNATIYPGVPEACDGLDNDCDGNTPAEETDADADGYRLCNDDCNDNDAAIYPNAPEVCDGKDNDCNGDMDEGPLETYFGNVTFNSQAELDAWLPCFNVIDGNVSIIGTDIDTLGPLSNIGEITGHLAILSNDLLETLNGLENLLTVGDSLAIYLNPGLTDCCAIDSLLETGGVQNAIIISDNNPFSDCNSGTSIMDNCPIVSAIGDLAGLRKGTLSLFPNPATGEVMAAFNKTKKQATLQIRDVLGRMAFYLVLERGTETVTIDLRKEGLSDGVYFVSVLDDGVFVSGELVVVGE